MIRMYNHTPSTPHPKAESCCNNGPTDVAVTIQSISTSKISPSTSSAYTLHPKTKTIIPIFPLLNPLSNPLTTIIQPSHVHLSSSPPRAHSHFLAPAASGRPASCPRAWLSRRRCPPRSPGPFHGRTHGGREPFQGASGAGERRPAAAATPRQSSSPSPPSRGRTELRRRQPVGGTSDRFSGGARPSSPTRDAGAEPGARARRHA